MSFDLIIKNGTVILENEARVVDIAVKDGKIAAIGQDLGDAKDVMDASGLVVSPSCLCASGLMKRSAMKRITITAISDSSSFINRNWE